MTTRSLSRLGVGLIVACAALVSGCGGGSDLVVGATPTPTPTLAPTPTHTPQAVTNSLTGLVVVRDDVAPRAPEFGVPPSNWGQAADQVSFDRAFANADFAVSGTTTSGTTAADGGFTIPDLAPGRYTIDLTKTVGGNLMPIAVPVVVGDRGDSHVVVEIAMGLVRTITTYEQDGIVQTDIRGPNGTWLVRRGDRLVELGDPNRALRDDDGDGRFDLGPCLPPPTACQSSERVCPDGTLCQCVSSCPFCDNCVESGVCAAPGAQPVYQCAPDGTCKLPGDHCVDTCPECLNGGLKVCVPGCEPIALNRLIITGPSQIVVGRDGQLFATAELSDGTAIDVTYLADWQSSDASVATVDSWGRASALQIGTASVTARFGDTSATVSLEVVARPSLRQIIVQNTGCVCPPLLARPQETGAFLPCPVGVPERADLLPFPSCTQTIVVGATLQFTALGEYADNTYEDLTDSVQWTVDPAAVGDVIAGTFTGRAAGTATVTASLGAIQSAPAEVRVVTEATPLSLSIFPANYAYGVLAGGPLSDASAASPCFECGAALTVLRGDTLQFQATAHYDTGEWRDVSAQVVWRSSESAVATIDSQGLLTAVDAGLATIEATFGAVVSNPITAKVVNTASIVSISIYQEGTDRVVAKADQRFFHATAAYDVGIVRDVTGDATWSSSNDNVGEFEAPGVLTARAAGVVAIWAEVDGTRSPSLSLEVYETSELAYCDPNDVNRAVWSDDFNRVLLESDCKRYTPPGMVTLRYSVTETRPHGGIFDPCLDLYVYDGGQRVRTIREEKCGDPFLPTAAPERDEAVLKYQLRAFWDLKDDKGEPVPPGTYTIYGRFYLYYDPVVSLTVEVGGGDGGG